jgi:imidazolonepropionase-like amidohydrolase
MDRVLFRNCNLFDGLSDECRPNIDVLVQGGVIEEVSDHPLDASGAKEVLVHGRTLMPGLIDAHVHVFAVDFSSARMESMPLTLMTALSLGRIRSMLDRGFTTVRDVGGADWGIREAVARGLIDGPRMFIGGPWLSPSGGHGDHRRRTDSSRAHDRNESALLFQGAIVDSPDEMRAVVREELRKGADHIKVMTSGGVGSPSDAIENVQFSPEELGVAVAEAQARSRYVLAHAYTNASIRHAVSCGVRCIEHANFIDPETAQFVASSGAFIVPTLVCFDETMMHADRLGLSPVVKDKLRQVNRAGIGMLEVCRSAGVRLGFGTDLVAEMERAQSREFTIRSQVERPVDILRSVTSVNAEIIQMAGRLGVVSAGAIADLVVVEEDPTKNIGVLDGQGERIPVVLKGGQFHRNLLDTRESGTRSYATPPQAKDRT